MSSISFRKASLQDAGEISTLVNSAYRGDSSRRGWTTEADLVGGQRTDSVQLEKIICGANDQIELATQNGQLVACVHLRWEPDHTLYFGMLTVHPELQDQGFGKALMARIEDLAKQKQILRLRISVIHLRFELIAFYKRLDFYETGASEPFHNDPSFGTPLRDDLRLIEFVKDIS